MLLLISLIFFSTLVLVISHDDQHKRRRKLTDIRELASAHQFAQSYGVPQESTFVWLLKNSTYCNWTTLLALLEDGIDVNERDLHGIPAICLLFDTTLPKQRILNEMLKAGVNLQAMDPQGNSVLFYAKDKESVQILLDAGVLVNARNAQGQTVLHQCTSTDIAQFLLNHGASVTIRDIHGRTPLHYANSVAIVSFLLQHGADPNIADNDGKTPLHYTTDKEIAYILLQSGADSLAQDNNGCKAPILSTFKTLPEYAPAPPLYDDLLRHALTQAIQNDSVEAAEDLLKRGAPPDNFSKYSHILTQTKSFKMTELLCRYRSNPNRGLLEKDSPLIHAIWNKDSATCQLLIDYGAVVTDYALKTAISRNAVECCKILLDMDPPITESAWNMAKNNGFSDIIELLANKRQHNDTHSEQLEYAYRSNGCIDGISCE